MKSGRIMYIKKIRGHKRIWKQITSWEKSNLLLDLENLQLQQRNYIKVYVSPYCDYTLLNSIYPAPKGKTRQYILESLLTIFESWKNQIQSLNQPYYLKLWLYEPDISKSQIVCSIGSLLDFYNLTFYKPESKKKFNTSTYGNLKGRLEKLQWEFALDETFIYPSELGTESDYCTKEDFLEEKKWYSNQINKAHRKIEDKSGNINSSTCYAIKNGVVWLGS